MALATKLVIVSFSWRRDIASPLAAPFLPSSFPAPPGRRRGFAAKRFHLQPNRSSRNAKIMAVSR